MYTDAHVHLDLYAAERLPLVLRAARRRGVGLMVTAGITWDASERGIEIAAREEGVYASVGVHLRGHRLRGGIKTFSCNTS